MSICKKEYFKGVYLLEAYIIKFITKRGKKFENLNEKNHQISNRNKE